MKFTRSKRRRDLTRDGPLKKGVGRNKRGRREK